MDKIEYVTAENVYNKMLFLYPPVLLQILSSPEPEG